MGCVPSYTNGAEERHDIMMDNRLLVGYKMVFKLLLKCLCGSGKMANTTIQFYDFVSFFYYSCYHCYLRNILSSSI